ncbi:MAG: hypothetical protein ACTSYB_07390 [Candidatus Helarchaeota archaeon]
MIDIPLEHIISLIIISITIILSFVIGKKALNSYREKGENSTLIIALASFFIAFAMIFLVLEQAFLSEGLPLYDEFLGMTIFGGIATIISGFAVVSFDLFAFNMVFPKKAAILTTIAAIVMSIYLIFWWADPTRHVENGEIVFDDLFGIGYPFTPLLSYFTLIPLFSIPIFVLLYYAIKVRSESPVMSTRAALLGLGGFALATAYTVELLGVDPWVTTGFRTLFVIASVMFYYALFKIKEQE